MNQYRVVWVDDGVGEINCTCGSKEIMIHEEDYKICDDCGRRYKLVQYVLMEESLGRCAYCGLWIYGVQKTRKKYCSEACGVLARRDKKILAEIS